MFMLREVMTGNLMSQRLSQRLSEKSDETEFFMCQSTECLAWKQKDRLSKYILISPDGERWECTQVFLANWI